MASKRPKQRTLTSFLWETLRQEWRIWLSIAVLLGITFLFSNQFATLLKDAPFIQVLDYLSKLGLLVAVIAFLREIPRWESRADEEAKRRQFEYWKAVDAATVAKETSRDGRFFSHALKMALESLVVEKDIDNQPLKIGPIDVGGAGLYGINLKNANFYVAGFRDADLSKADFSNATLHIAYFMRARLFGTNFQSASFYDVSLRHALYDDDTQFPDGLDPAEKAKAYRISPKANLQEAMLVQAMLWDVDLEGANLQGADMRGAIIGGEKSNFRNADLQQANLWRARAAKADLTGATLRNASLREANLEDVKLTNADLYGADLSGARNITVKQIQSAQNWEQATYDSDFYKELGLLS